MMLEELISYASRLSAQLERDAVALNEPSAIPETQRRSARQAIDRALAAAGAMLESLHKAAESEKLR
jgi:hypothetical protein